jgi:hypothetical protein
MLTGMPEVQAVPAGVSDYAIEPATADAETVSCLQ